MKAVNLATIKNGAIVDMFNEELKKVLKNIADDNTSAKTIRGVTVKVLIKPDETRQIGAVQIDVSSKLAPVKPTSGLLFFSYDESGDLAAFEDAAEQQNLTDTRTNESIFKMAVAAQE